MLWCVGYTIFQHSTYIPKTQPLTLLGLTLDAAWFIHIHEDTGLCEIQTASQTTYPTTPLRPRSLNQPLTSHNKTPSCLRSKTQNMTVTSATTASHRAHRHRCLKSPISPRNNAYITHGEKHKYTNLSSSHPESAQTPSQHIHCESTLPRHVTTHPRTCHLLYNLNDNDNTGIAVVTESYTAGHCLNVTSAIRDWHDWLGP